MSEVSSGPRSSDRLSALIDTLQLPDLQKQLLRERWLDQLGWTSRQAVRARRRYLWLRIPVVVGGVMIPGFVSMLLGGGDSISWLGNLPIWVIRLVTFVLSLGVAILVAVEQVLNYGDRWRHYRRTAELLKTLGWQYLMLTGTFRRFSSHTAAFGPFTERVEDALNEDVEGYLGQIATEAGDRAKPEVLA
jgi:Protein of unknown function (DUF4231)